MPIDKNELKVRLMKQAEKQIDELLVNPGLDDRMSLEAIEGVVQVTGDCFRKALLQRLVEEQHVETGVCPDCGGALRHKGHKTRQIMTGQGPGQIERVYYQCTVCGRGYFPPGQTVRDRRTDL